MDKAERKVILCDGVSDELARQLLGHDIVTISEEEFNGRQRVYKRTNLWSNEDYWITISNTTVDSSLSSRVSYIDSCRNEEKEATQADWKYRRRFGYKK